MNVVKQFFKSVRNSEHTTELISENGEVLLDALLKDGLLKDVPILGSALAFIKLGDDIRGQLLANKLLMFLTEAAQIPEHERKKFAEDKLASEDGMEEIGEVTLNIIDKLESAKLARMLGRSFRLMVTDEIDRAVFEHHSHIIKGLSGYLLRQFRSAYRNNNAQIFDLPGGVALAGLGLLEMRSATATLSGGPQNPEFEPTRFGRYFYEEIVQPVLDEM